MNDALYVTTTIPYVNASPHVGFALELVQADVIARYHRLCGTRVRFQTGTDENAYKNVLSARALGIPVRELVDRNAERFRALADQLSISHDAFVRTTGASHHRAVHAFLGRLRPNDVYQSSYRGRYCAGCEDFYLERDLNGALCPEHLTPVIEVAERNHFFRLSAYADRLHELIASRRLRVIPEAREAEVLRFIARGLTDISLSRDAARSGRWGVPYPGDSDQVVYVWIDALVNYLSGLGFPEGDDVREFWGGSARRLHLIGKNVWKFHAVYWPALLLSAGLDVPDRIVVHGFLTNEGRKISKSSGDAPDPADFVSAFGADAVRFFLLRHVRPFEDTDFSLARLSEAYNADLANGLGNLCSRITTLCEAADVSPPDRSIPPPPPACYHESLEAYRPDLVLEALWNEIRSLNRAVAADRPWDDIGAGRHENARATLGVLAARLDALAYWLAPFLPASAAAIRTALSGPRIRKCPPLFPRRRQGVPDRR